MRYAAITATDCHPWTPFEPSPMTTMGAIARIGTVCDPTTNGSRPRSRKRTCESRTASAKPKTPPSRNPAIASFIVKSAALKSEWMSGGPPVVVGSQKAWTTSYRCGMVVSFTGKGHPQPAACHSAL